MTFAVNLKKQYPIFVFLSLVILFGCAAGAQKTVQEPVYAENGFGVTIWKIPILGLGGWGNSSGQAPSVIVHKYDYQVKPLALATGTPPNLGTAPPVDYQTTYESAWNDPTLVIFKNDSYRRVRIEINGRRPIILEAYGATADLHLGIGEHRVRVTIEKPTATQGALELVRFFSIFIRPESRSQIFHIYDS